MVKKGRPASGPKKAEEIPGQAERLVRLREAYGFASNSAFARFLEMPVTTYNSFENGAPLSRQAVFRIVQKLPGISSDWLYFNKPDGLSVDVARRLGLLGPPPPPGKRRS